jgi:hypothetical protein
VTVGQEERGQESNLGRINRKKNNPHRGTTDITTDGKWISKKEQIFPEINCCFHKKRGIM